MFIAKEQSEERLSNPNNPANRCGGAPVYQVQIEHHSRTLPFVVHGLLDTLEEAEEKRQEIEERTRNEKRPGKVVVAESGVKRTPAPSCFRCGREGVSVYRFEDGWIGCRRCRVKDLSGEE